MSEHKRILAVNILSEVFPMGPSFPVDAPPFYGATNQAEVNAIKDDGSRKLAEAMVSLCMKLQQRSVSLAKEGDMIPLQAPVDPDHVRHIVGDCFGMNPENISLLAVRNQGRLTLPEAILADPHAVGELRKFVNGQGEKVIISPFAVDDGVRAVAQEIGAGYGHEWPHEPQRIVPNGRIWRYPDNGWSLWRANSKARNHVIAREIDPNWVPEDDIVKSPSQAGGAVARMLEERGLEEVGVKADINVDGMGNVRFRKVEKDRLVVTYESDIVEYSLGSDNKASIAQIVEAECRERGIYISERHRAVVEKWEQFFLGLAPSVEIYTPPLETGLKPFIINECDQIIKDGSYVGSINPAPLTVSLERLRELPKAYWDTLGISMEEFMERHRPEYLKAWERQRELSIKFGERMQKMGEVGQRDFDFGIIQNPDGTMSPKLCESNGRRTGTWVADTVGRRLWGPDYLQQGYVMSIDNLGGSVFDRDFRSVHGMFARHGGIFTPDTKTGIILTGHIRNGSGSRLMTTIVGPDMGNVWNSYKLTQDVLSWE